MTLLEVERKFAFNNHLLRTFQSNFGKPPFHALRKLRTESFQDIYYDKSNVLSTNNLWVRKRNSVWEAKYRQGGDFTNSTFYETNDTSEIRRLVSRFIKPSSAEAGPEVNFVLDELCRFRTRREVFVADERFTVVLDEMDFGHLVGEVEVLVGREAVVGAHASIAEFMRRYAWFFLAGGRPVGKMTAYFERFGRPG